jgi:hypothetical protein
VPLFLILMLLSASLAAFHSTFFLIVFALQIVFYLTALIGWFLERNENKGGILAIPLYFVLANSAALLGFYKFSEWRTIRALGADPRRRNECK